RKAASKSGGHLVDWSASSGGTGYMATKPRKQMYSIRAAGCARRATSMRYGAAGNAADQVISSEQSIQQSCPNSFRSSGRFSSWVSQRGTYALLSPSAWHSAQRGSSSGNMWRETPFKLDDRRDRLGELARFDGAALHDGDESPAVLENRDVIDHVA